MSDMRAYEEIIGAKERYAPATGFRVEADHPWLWPFQRRAVEWALAGGSRALFEDTGLGKSRQQLAWAHHVHRHTGERVLILAPLAVGPQTVREAASVGLDGVTFAQSEAEAGAAPIVVTNYASVHKFESFGEAGIVLDESSILKSFVGKTKVYLCDRFKRTPFRLAATATPAPNDYLELGNHSEFLGILSSHQMIARWFINDTSQMGTYRLKGHAVRPFWDWVTSWAMCAGLPSDIGPYDDAGYVLPELHMHRHVINVDIVDGREEGALFRLGALSATGVHKEKRRTVKERAAAVSALVRAEPDEPWIVWCETDYEAAALMEALPGGAVEVSGSMPPAVKTDRLLGFVDRGGILVTKPDIAGFGMNWQHCARMVVSGGTYSYEKFYQLVRRCWRFGQQRPVHCHVVMAVTEQGMWDVVTDKSDAHATMKREMFAASRRAQSRAAAMLDYHPTHEGRLPAWLITRPEVAS
jgi:hypothetical protein